jgi:hypothetical protein
MLSNKRHKVYPGSGRGPYVQQWRAQGTILLSTGGPVVGLLQARRERERGSQVPGVVAEDVVVELESKCAMRPVSCCVFSSIRPLWQGGSSPFYRPRRERITCMPRYLAMWGSVVCYAVEQAAALTILAAIWPSWRILYRNSGGFEGRRAADGCGVLRWARGGY